MHRFFVPPDWITPPLVTLQDPVTHQIRNVLRMRPGDKIMLLDNAGHAHTVTLDNVSGKMVTARIDATTPAQGEPPIQLALYQALLKKDNFEWVLQKCTEIGVTQFVPLETQRTIVPLSSVNSKKHARWERILTEAAEQSRRGRIPDLASPLTLDDALAACETHDLVLIPWEDETTRSLDAVLAAHPTPQDVAVMIGPEGGYTPDEIEHARDVGAIPITLGPRILRAETAAIAASLLVLHAYGALEQH